MELKLKQRILLLSLLFIIARLVLAYAFKDSYFDRGNRHTSINLIAYNLLDNGTFGLSEGNPSGVNEPIYTGLVTFAYWLFGRNWFGVALLQSIALSIGAFVIYRISFGLWQNHRISLASLVLVNLYPFYFTQSISVSDTVIYSMLLAVAIYLSILCMRKNKTILFILAGFVWGLLLLTRFSGISILGVVIVFQLAYYGWSYFPRLLIIGLATVLTMIPWIIRNYNHTERVFLTSHGSIEIWMGHNQMTEEVISNDISVDILRLERDSIPGLDSLQRSNYQNDISYEYAEGKYYISAAISYLKENPYSLITMAPLKFAKFWSVIKNPSTNSRDTERKNTGLSKYWDILYTIYYTPLLIFFLVGITFVLFKKNKIYLNDTLVVLLGAFIGYTILHTFVFGFTRLRVPLDQFIIMFAVYGFHFLFIRKRPWYAKTI